MTKRTICIICPISCSIKAKITDGMITDISGHKCKRGIEYIIAEIKNPVRTLTTTVKTNIDTYRLLPVRSDKPIPERLIFECMKKINTVLVDHKVKMGDIIIENILDTNVNIISTSDIL